MFHHRHRHEEGERGEHRHGERDHSHPRGGRFGRFLHERSSERAGHGPRGHGGGRVFDQGDLRWVVLRLISEKPSHGYELIKAIEERLGGAYSPSPGVVYPTLTLLEDLGLAAVVQSEGAKKAYAITEEGAKALADNAAIVEALFQRMAGIAERAGGGPAPQIIRAMENLRLALRLKLERGRLTEVQVTETARALDAAAQAIEKD
jgi:DNA-binding PadR family transcriptional regulator